MNWRGLYGASRAHVWKLSIAWAHMDTEVYESMCGNVAPAYDLLPPDHFEKCKRCIKAVERRVAELERQNGNVG